MHTPPAELSWNCQKKNLPLLAARSRAVLLVPQAVERPGGVFTDDGVRMPGSLLEPGHKPLITGIAHGHAQIAQPAAVLRTLDGRMGEDSAEVRFTNRGQGVQRRVEQRKAGSVRGQWSVVRGQSLTSTSLLERGADRRHSHRLELRYFRSSGMRGITTI